MRISLSSCLPFILHFWVCLSIHISVVSGHCLEDQQLLLLQLKNQLEFKASRSSKLVSWNQSLPCCDWEGVTCDEKGHVTGLDLSGEIISGGFDNSSTLFSLQYLQNLNLANNDFNSVIPSEIQKLKNLTSLNLSQAGFVEQIPFEISQLTRLVVLDVSAWYDLDGINIMKLVQKLTEVRELYLDGINISLVGNEWSNALSYSVPHLQVLSMSYCNLSGPIDSSLQMLKNLSVINLSRNSLSGIVPKFFANFSNLTSLDLSSCGLGGRFPEEIFQIQSLSFLDLSYNIGLQGSLPNFPQNGSLHTLILRNTSFSGAYPNSIANLRQLSILEISQCQLYGSLPDSLSNLTELTYLDLSFNNFRGPIPPFGMAKKLTLIDLSNNHLSGEISSAHFEGLGRLVSINLHNNFLTGKIPSSLFVLPSLESIRLSNNSFQGQLDGISNASSFKLETLDLSSNNLEGLIDTICRLENLEMLDLSGNNLSTDADFKDVNISCLPNIKHVYLVSCKLKKFPAFLRNLSTLDGLDLSDNQITGKIPDWICGLENLHELDLSGNNLSTDADFKDVNISCLPNIKHVYLVSCKLKKFPAFLRNLSTLDGLDLSDNQITGKIPDWICGLDNLHELDLSGNNLSTGADFKDVNISCLPNINQVNLVSCKLKKFPAFLRNLSTLDGLDLSDNQITGKIPDWICGLENLHELDLSGNNLSTDADFKDVNISCLPNIKHVYLVSCKLKKFPAFLRNLSTLAGLDLSDNQITGKIPDWTWQLGGLSVLNLSYNSLMMIERPPHNLSSNLVTLDLHNNNFQGSLPPFPQGVKYLDYSINNFTSSIPHSICNASDIQVLDLSFNNLDGMIPNCLVKSENLRVLNLGNNNLSGNIPDTFLASCFLETLDLNGNNLKGPIPRSLSKCTSLEVIDLGNNEIHDQFPCLLKNVSAIRVMVLRNNSFHGPIWCPKIKGISWNMLQIVDLAHNNFNGTLPGNRFTTWKVMMLDENHVATMFNLHYDSECHNYNRACDELYYQNRVKVTSKGNEMPLNKILNIFTAIDFSSNKLEGPIPEEMMDFKALHVLNLSNNNLLGYIPSSIGKMKQLESLDLSNNSLSGEIPPQLASLSFLEFLNLSFNHLVGMIPTGTQLQSFEPDSFKGNDGLYGPPLTKITSDKKHGMLPPPTSRNHHKFNLNLITSVELGVVFGLGIIIGPILFWKKWRIRYWKCVDNILCSIFPQLYFDCQRYEGQMYKVLRWMR